MALCALLVGCASPRQESISTTQHELNIATDLRVATWNIEGVGARGTVEYDAALALLARIGADVVGINEVATNADIDNFLDLAADAGYSSTIVPSSNPLGSQRNAFMSVHPLSASAIHTSPDLSGDPLANDLTRNIVSITVDLPDNTRDLVLAVEHWKAAFGDSDEFRRAVESIRMTQVVAGLDPATDAFLLMGDMNEEIDSVPREPNLFVTLPAGLPGAFNLGADLLAELNGPGIVNDPFHYLQRVGGPEAVVVDALQKDGDDGTRPSSGRRLDYLFVSRSIDAEGVQSEVYDSGDEALAGGLPKFGAPLPASTSADASDHFLVFADITVPRGEGCSINADCDDGEFCNGVERCVLSTCEAGTPVSCDDGISCSSDSCNELTDSCDNVPSDGACDDANVCTDDRCDLVLDCRNLPVGNDTPCGDGDLCNGPETCQSGTCTAGVPLDCNDRNACTSDSCSAILGCQNPALGDGTSCSDSDACNGAETCLAGTCVAGTPLSCQDDGNPCTAESCDAVLGCISVAVADGTSCTDSNACNGAETCLAGICMNGAPLSCQDDGNPCTEESCDAALGCVNDNIADGTSCTDGNVCNGDEICQSGSCAAGVALDCDDGGECTADICDAVLGCMSEPVPSGTPCAGGSGVCNARGRCFIGDIAEPEPETSGGCSATSSPSPGFFIALGLFLAFRPRRRTRCQRHPRG